jgi:predicted metal-binding membrane protein
MCAQKAPRFRSAPPLPEGGALAALLLACSGAAWLVTTQLMSAEMKVGLLTSPQVTSSADQMNAMGMPPLGSFIGIWAVMMVAMLVPSLWPVARAVDATRRATRRKFDVTLLFIAGYLLTWSAVGPAAYIVMSLLQNMLPAGSVASLRGGAVLLLVAGAYQLTPFKQACLRKCHAPHVRFASDERMRTAGSLATVSEGLAQGAYCLGSSWPLMLVLLLLGMMNLVWMGVVAVMILLEKALPSGQTISKVVGVGLIGAGIVLIAAPHPLPALLSHPGWSQLGLFLH